MATSDPDLALDDETHQLPDDEKAADEAARRLAEMIRKRSIPVDVHAADEIKRGSLNRAC